jgi:serine-threonine kinase receptor-associated protein
MSSGSLRQVPLTCPGHTRPVVHVHFSDVDKDGKSKFISASKDGKPMLHHGDTGDWIGTFDGHKGAVWGCCLNTDATRAATGAADFTAKLWNALTGVELISLPHKHIVKCVDFSHDTINLLTGCNDKSIRLFHLGEPNKSPSVTFEGHSDSIKCISWSGDPNLFVSSEETPSIKLWDIRTKSFIKDMEMPGDVNNIEISKDQATLTISHTNGVTFMDAKK